VRLYLLLFLSLIIFTASTSQKKNVEQSLLSNKLQVDAYVEKVSSLMSNEKYDSASIIVTTALNFADSTEYTEGKYYLYALESEILYYNSLFSPALNSAFRALKYAEALSNDTLVGSIQNLIGLLMSNLNQYADAEAMLRSSFQKLPFNHANENLSYRFHAASNLCGVFMHLQQIDSAIKYARVSLGEASTLHRNRAVAIDYWNLSRAHLLQKNYDSASYYAMLGKQIAQDKNIADVKTFFISLEAEILINQGQAKQSVDLLKHGINQIESANSLTVFAKIDFLNEAVKLLIQSNDFETASKAQVLLNKLKYETDEKRNNEQIKMLERFYANEKRLELSESLRQKREAEAKLNSLALIATITISVFILIVIAFSVFAFIQRQNIKTLELHQEKEALSLQNEKDKIEERILASNFERNRIAKELHDDIGSSLSSISLYADLALREAGKDAVKSLSLLEKINQKSKEINETMSDIIWAVYSKNDSFNNLMMRMKNFVFEMVVPLNIEVDFHYPFHLDELTLNLEQRKNIYFIFKEAVNNAVKHSKCTHINVLVEEMADDKISMKISDNGIGFDIIGVKKNNGFYTMQSRGKQIGGNTIIQSTLRAGTTILVEFPKHQL